MKEEIGRREDAEKGARTKKKARATKGTSLEPLDVGLQERPLEPSFECPIELPHPHLNNLQ